MKARPAILKACVFTGLMGMIIGCTTIGNLTVPKKIVSVGTTDYNLGAETAQNEMLLLNIVRASKSYPMYFTTFSDMKGSLTWTVGAGTVTIPFGSVNGGGSGSSYTVGPTGQLSANPLFSVALSNNKEFLMGIFEPVKPEILYYYWQQGWPRELLLNLFVGRIGGDAINNPMIKVDEDKDKRSLFERFQKEVGDMGKPEPDKCEFVTHKSADDIGPEIGGHAAAKLKDLVKAQGAGLKLEKREHGKYQLTAPQDDEYFLKCPCTEEDKSCREYQLYSFAGKKPKGDEKSVSGVVAHKCKAKEEITCKAKEEITVETKEGNKVDLDVSDEKLFAGGIAGYDSIDDVKEGDSVTVGYAEKNHKNTAKSVSKSTRIISLRSPEAMLYYLGEIMRYRAIKKAAPFMMKYGYPSQCPDRPIDLFMAREAYRGEIKPSVSVEHEGETYIIPYPGSDKMCYTDESMHVLSLMSLLIAKQQSASQLPPPTGVTTSIGGK